MILVAVLFFGGLALVAWASGVFGKLSGEERALLAAFALVYALGTCALDRGVRAYLGGLPRALPVRFGRRLSSKAAWSPAARRGAP